MVKHLAVDGSYVTLDGPIDGTLGFSSYLHAAILGRPQEFGVGPLNWASEIASDDQTVYEEDYSYQGGRLRMGFDWLVDPTTGGTLKRRTAVWEGKSYSMSAFVHERSYDELFLTIDQFTFVEANEGLTLRIKDSKKNPLDLSRPPNLLKMIPKLGICQAQEFNTETSKSVPKWEGQRVEGGELYMERSPEGYPHFLLVGESAVTSIMTNESIDGEDAYKIVSELVVTWDRG